MSSLPLPASIFGALSLPAISGAARYFASACLTASASVGAAAHLVAMMKAANGEAGKQGDDRTHGELADRTMKLALPARVVYSSREAPPSYINL